MLKKLRLKIILAIVLVAAVMLGAILGLFYTLTKQNLRTQSISMMQAIAADPFSPVQPGQEPQQVHLPYFVLQTDAFGNLVAIGSSDYDLTDRAFLRMVAAAAQASQDAIGEIPEYSLRYCRVTGSVIFADISSEQQTLRTLLKTGALLVALGLLAFFGLAVLLAHSAVKPVEQAWRQQKQFVADASHELKTPLTVILTNTELLQSPDYDAVQKQTFLSGIDAMAKQMRALVERLLELARAENEQAACAFEPCDLSQITESSALLFEAALFERGLTLQTELEADIMVSGDRRQLSQLVEIYLDNARKYASGGTVTVRLSRCGKNRCRLSLSRTKARRSRRRRCGRSLTAFPVLTPRGHATAASDSGFPSRRPSRRRTAAASGRRAKPASTPSSPNCPCGPGMKSAKKSRKRVYDFVQSAGIPPVAKQRKK